MSAPQPILIGYFPKLTALRGEFREIAPPAVRGMLVVARVAAGQ